MGNTGSVELDDNGRSYVEASSVRVSPSRDDRGRKDAPMLPARDEQLERGVVSPGEAAVTLDARMDRPRSSLTEHRMDWIFGSRVCKAFGSMEKSNDGGGLGCSFESCGGRGPVLSGSGSEIEEAIAAAFCVRNTTTREEWC